MWHIKKAHSFYPDMTKVKVAEFQKTDSSTNMSAKAFTCSLTRYIIEEKKF